MRIFWISICWLLAAVIDKCVSDISGAGYGLPETNVPGWISVIQKAHGNAERLKRLLRIKKLEQLVDQRFKDDGTGDDQASAPGTYPVNERNEGSTATSGIDKYITSSDKPIKPRDSVQRLGHQGVSQIEQNNENRSKVVVSPKFKNKQHTREKSSGRTSKRSYKKDKKSTYSSSYKKKHEGSNKKYHKRNGSPVSKQGYRGSSTHSKQHHAEMKGSSLRRNGQRGSSKQSKHYQSAKTGNSDVSSSARMKKVKATSEKLKDTVKQLKTKIKKFKGTGRKRSETRKKHKRKSKKHKTSKKVKDTTTKHEGKRKTLKRKNNKNKRTSKKLKAENKKLIATIKKLKEKSRKLKGSSKTHERTSNKHKWTRKKLKSASKKLKDTINKLKGIARKLKGKHSKHKGTGKKLKTESNNLMLTIKKLKEKIRKLKGSSKTHKRTSNKHKWTRKKLKSASKKLKDTINKLKGIARKLKVKHSKHRRASKKLKTESKNLMLTIKKFKEKIRKLKGSSKTHKGTTKKLKGASKKLKGASKKLKGASKKQKSSSKKHKGTGKSRNENKLSKHHRKGNYNYKNISRTGNKKGNVEKISMNDCLKHVMLNLKPNFDASKIKMESPTISNLEDEQATSGLAGIQQLGKDINYLNSYANVMKEGLKENQETTSGNTNVKDGDKANTNTKLSGENCTTVELVKDSKSPASAKNVPKTAKNHIASVHKQPSLLSDKILWLGMAVGSGFSFVTFILCCCFYRCLLRYRSTIGAPFKDALGLFKDSGGTEKSPVHIKLSHTKANNNGSSQYVVSIMGKKETGIDSSSEEEEVYNRSSVRPYGGSPMGNNSTQQTPVKTKKPLLQ